MFHQQFTIGQGAFEQCHTLSLPSIQSMQELKAGIARIFSVSDSDSICFYNQRDVLTSLDRIENNEGPVNIRVNGEVVREPSGPEPLPYVGNRYELYPDPLGNYDRLFARYGPVVKTINMGTTIYLTNDPDVSREVQREGEFFTKTTSDPSHPLYYMRNNEALFTCDSDAPAFKLAHKFIPPSLTPKAVRHYTPTILACVERSFNVFDELDEKELAFNVYQYTFKMAGEIIWKVILGMDLGHFDTIDTRPHETMRYLGEYLSLMKKISMRGTWYGYLPFGMPKRLKIVRKLLWDGVAKGIEESTRTMGDLPMKDAALHAASVADYLRRATDEHGEKLPESLLLSNCVIMVGAGFVTTSSLLAWLVYALVNYPGNQERLLQELINYGACSNKLWSYEELSEMPFLDKFVKETQRMHNPSFQTARNAKQDVVLPGGYFIPKGSVIIPTFPSLHKNPRHWDNPTRFDPDRWDTSAVKERHKMAYTPFAAGARGCIGYNLAFLEVKSVLVKLVYRYHFENASTEAVVYDPEFIVVRPLNFYARAIRRTRWPEKQMKA
ncbi:cytochrome P450 82A2 [Colletotrichum zoysiae]|uniref:Cytochrome P450 82A2 n=1 Tax=Colletotrichum zoysiae TaxID=1216348 RepID=A0AAD9LZH5_9PEZI|nr:cytochrome P450 82A2 [Colletotrichum zoysiae]